MATRSRPATDAQRAARAALDHAMDAYARGDEAAFAVLYDGLAPRLFGYLMRQTRQVAWTEDLVQQTFLHLHAARGSFIAGAQVLPWAFAIARRLFIDDRRRRGRAPALAGHAPLGDRPSAATAPDEALYAVELARALERTAADLPRAQREALLLLKARGLSLAEAARALGTTMSAVKLRSHRAYAALRACL